MPDDRLFHKRLGHSEKVGKLTDLEFIVWMGYILSADDFGVMRFSAVTLQADHDRLGKRPQKVIQKALETVRDVRLMATFEHQGRMHCASADWQNHQRVKFPRQTINPKPPAGLLAAFTPATQALFKDWPGKTTKKFVEDSPNPSETFPTLARAGTPETLTLTLKANANPPDAREPFESFTPELPADSVEGRAGDFVERYKALHVRLRKGAHYIGSPGKDFYESRQLVAVYDDARLDKLAYVWLNTDHDFAQNGTRSLAKFRSMASWCEEQLIAWEEQHGPLQVAS